MLTLGGERFKEQLQLESVEDVKTVCDAAGLEFVHLPDGGFDVLKPNRKVCPYHTYPPPPPLAPSLLAHNFGVLVQPGLWIPSRW